MGSAPPIWTVLEEWYPRHAIRVGGSLKNY